MKYKIEFELPDNSTIQEMADSIYVKWSFCGYGGYVKAKPYEEEPRGEWILNEGKLNNPICNQCGCKNDYVRNFCPVCGADMRGAE